MNNIIKLVKNHCFEEDNKLEVVINDYITLRFWKVFRTDEIYATVYNNHCKMADFIKLNDLKSSKTKRLINEFDIDYKKRLEELLLT